VGAGNTRIRIPGVRLAVAVLVVEVVGLPGVRRQDDGDPVLAEPPGPDDEGRIAGTAVEGIELSRLEVVVDSESDDRGILGIDEGVPAGPLRMRVRVRLSASGASQTALREIAAWGHQHCPVSDAVNRAIDSSLEVEAV